MMDYEMFKAVMVECLPEFMPDRFSGCDAQIRPVTRINREEDGLFLVQSGAQSGQSSPLICVCDMYEKYVANGSVNDTLSEAAKVLVDLWENSLHHAAGFSLGEIRDKVVMQLVNTEQNESLLQESPHRLFHDLSIIYKIVISVDAGGERSVRVTNSLAGQMGMEEPELYKLAMENTKRLFPPVVMSMDEMVMKLTAEGAGMSMPVELDEMPDWGAMGLPSLYVVTNDIALNGAVSMLYEENLHSLAQRLGEDLYILPSSLHEVIAVPAGSMEAHEVAWMVEEANMAEVPLEDKLSNQVYLYDRNLREITPISDVPVKGIGMEETGMPTAGRINEQAR